MKIVYIHGANASGISFNYIRHCLNYDNELIVEYNSFAGYEYNLTKMKRLLSETNDNLFFICHSMGGLYAVSLASAFSERTIGAVTMSTPYGGSAAADYAKHIWPFNRLLHEISTTGSIIKTNLNTEIEKPWCNIVTTSGRCLWISEPNDGVVTVRSQSARKDMELEEVGVNHYEVVMDNRVIELTKTKIFQYSGNSF